jgi:hypothetical protein
MAALAQRVAQPIDQLLSAAAHKRHLRRTDQNTL